MKNIKRLSDGKVFDKFVIIPGLDSSHPCSKCIFSTIHIDGEEGEYLLGKDFVLTNEYTEEQQAIIDRMYPNKSIATSNTSLDKENSELEYSSIISRYLNNFKRWRIKR